MFKLTNHFLFRIVVIGLLLSLNTSKPMLAKHAQQSVLNVSGQVVDIKGESLVGVSIFVKGTTTGTTTDVNGNFNIEVSQGNTLVFSFIGFNNQEIVITDQKNLEIILIENLEELDEVVVVGYGSQRKKDVTGAISTVGEEDMVQRPNTQVGSLLQGKAAGVQVLSSSGKPSQGLSIRIRGINSIGAGSEPLYVVDGVPTADTRSINPADIEDISVLKDAASAAIYGAQGGNGVVIISTKRGKSASPTLSLDTYFGFSQVWKQLDVLNGEQYRDLMLEMGQDTYWDRYYHNTDWQDEIFQNGTSQNYQLSLSGANDKTNYYISGGWTEQIGAVRSAEMKRANFKINLDQQVNDWVKAGTRISYTKYSDVDVNDFNSTNRSGVLVGALATPPVIGIYNRDGSFTSNPFQNWENPIASTDGTDRGYKSQRFGGNAYLEFAPVKNLKYKINFGVEESNGLFESFLDPFRTTYGQAIKGEAISNVDKYSYHVVDNLITYDLEIEKNKFDFIIGRIDQRFLWENNNVTTRNFASDGITTPNAGSEMHVATAYKAEKSNISYISRVNYSYEDKYLFTGNFRADGSSIFGPGKRWGYFPSFSAGWRISNEEFMKDIDAISDLKIRAGWGIVGNDQFERYAYLGRVSGGANYPVGGEIMPGTYPVSIENEKLKWEESEQISIGIDASLFDNRLRLTIDAYEKNTYDLLLQAPLPLSTGFGSALQNIGKLQNRGIEFSANSVNVDKEIKWNTDFNISFNKNEVVDLVGEELLRGYVANRDNASLVREGLPLGTLYGYVYGGVDPSTGNALYMDANGESTSSPSPDDRTIIGDANPDFYYGMTNNLSYKRFGLTVFLQGSYGNDMLNATRIETESMIDPKNQTIAVENRWRNPGDITDIPKASWGNTDNSRISTRFIEDASYLRVKTITLSYSFDGGDFIKDLKLYATGENLFTITNYSGFDPEVNRFGGSNTEQGIDFGTYPQTRNLILGLKLTF